MTRTQLQSLATELNTDPNAYGYAAKIAVGDDEGVAAIINTVRDGSNGASIPIRRSNIASKEIVEAIRVTDYTALPANPNATQLSNERRFLSWMESLVNASEVRLLNDDGTDTPVISNFQDMFPAGSGTRTRLFTLATRNGSRAEQLFGANFVVTASDVAKALRG